MSTWYFNPFLKMGVTSAHFKQEGKFPDWRTSFKVEWMQLIRTVVFSFMILVGTSLFWVILDKPKDLIFFFQNITSFYSFKCERVVFI